MKTKIINFLVITFIICFSAKADDSRIDNSVLINANQISYNDSIKVVTAIGNVEVVRDGSIIWADEITFNKIQNIIIAKDNITFKNKDGNISYGSKMIFDNNMKTGFIESPQSILIDETKIAAASGERKDDLTTSLKNAVYSPCQICEGDENPIWQIKATEVISSEEDMNVYYKDAWLEVYGIPVFYTPFLTHPDPRVKRRSGWLASSVESSSNVGLMIKNNYYWDIAPNTDATLEFTAIDLIKTPMIGGEFRHLFKNGKISIDANMTLADSKDSSGNITGTNSFQGHLSTKGNFSLNEYWRMSFDLNMVSDDNYFDTYNIQTEDEDMLTSNIKFEGFYGNDFLGLTAYKFKDMRPNIPVKQPLIMPYAEYSFKGDNFLNSDWIFEGDLLALNQEDGEKEVKLYNQMGIEKNYLSSFGMTLDIGADLYTRSYLVDQKDKSKNNRFFELMPQLSFLTKYPLQKVSESGLSTIIEPMANIIIAPNGANDDEIPNQDSTVLDLDYTNLFSKNRLAGTDRLEDGIRGSYGVKTSFLNKNGGYSSIFLGQAYRKKENNYLFSESSGLKDKFSDIILEAQLKPNPYINLDYYSLFDKDSLSSKKHEAYFSLGKDSFRVLGSYFFEKENATMTNNANSQELNLGFSSKLNDYWRISANSISSLGNSGEGLLKSTINLEYTDECFSIGLYGERDLTNRKGMGSETAFMLRVGLKNLGEFDSPSLSTSFLIDNNDN